MTISTRTPKGKLLGILERLSLVNVNGFCIVTDNKRYFLSEKLYENYINSDSESLTVVSFNNNELKKTFEVEIKDIKRIGYRIDKCELWEEINI